MDPAGPHPLSPEQAVARLGRDAWVDVRDEAAFALGHLPGCGNLPLASWSERRHEWPPPDIDIVTVTDDPAQAREAAVRFAAAGRQRVAWLDAPWTALGVAPVRDPAARLWRPSPTLERLADRLPRGRALDLACGSGRDAVFLGLLGFRVEAWDHDPVALGLARDLARRHGVELRTVEADLETPESPDLGESAFELLVCFRYLHRPLFPAIERALAPGGHLIYETYREGQEQWGTPRRPRFLLRAGELRAAFPGLDTLEFEEPSPPGGPITARLLARRPAR